MTDITKWRNVSLSHATYAQLQKQSKKICDVDLSISQTVAHNANVMESILQSKNWVKPFRGNEKYREWKTKLMGLVYPNPESFKRKDNVVKILTKLTPKSKDNSENTH